MKLQSKVLRDLRHFLIQKTCVSLFKNPSLIVRTLNEIEIFAVA